MSGELLPEPDPDDTTRFFWEGAAAGRLLLQRCSRCGRCQYPPDVVCVWCQSDRLDIVPVSGRGTLYSFAIVDRAFHPGFASSLPYVVAMVELTERPEVRMLTNVVGGSPRELRVGMAMEVEFETRGAVTMPQFRPAGGPA